MRLMLVNDDGYMALGINVLARALADAGHEVVICAPDSERSAVSHAIFSGVPLTARPFANGGVRGYAINGTPADSARLGLYILDMNVDMVVSGINHGPNVGGACVYSGTVGAAMEASMNGVPALAVSLCSYGDPRNLEAAAKVALKVLDWAAARPLSRGEIYNLNVPDIPYEELRGVRSATLSNEYIGVPMYDTEMADGETVYIRRYGSFLPNTDPGCDAELNKKGWATLTPLTWNMISRNEMEDPQIRL